MYVYMYVYTTYVYNIYIYTIYIYRYCIYHPEISQCHIAYKSTISIIYLYRRRQCFKAILYYHLDISTTTKQLYYNIIKQNKYPITMYTYMYRRIYTLTFTSIHMYLSLSIYIIHTLYIHIPCVYIIMYTYIIYIYIIYI